MEALKQIAAPSELADFHRLLVAYYSVNFLGEEKDPQSVSKVLDQIESQLVIMRIGVESSMGLKLP